MYMSIEINKYTYICIYIYVYQGDAFCVYTFAYAKPDVYKYEARDRPIVGWIDTNCVEALGLVPNPMPDP